MNAATSTAVASTLPAFASGGAWEIPADYPTSLAESLRRSARLHPAHGVTCLDGTGGASALTYPELCDHASRVLTGLRQRGLQPGQAVIFQLEDNLDFITAFWACIFGGFVVVPLGIAPTYEQPHSVLAKLHNTWKMLERPLVVASPALAPRLRDFAAREQLDGLVVESIEALRGPQPATEWHPTQPDDLALLLLTSGSTGKPKAVRHTHRTLLRWATSVAETCQLEPSDVSLNWMPLDHVGGIVMFHLRDAVLGCRQYHAPTEPVLQRPLTWLDWIERYRITVTWAPNFAFGLVNEQADELARGKWSLSSLRYAMNGGEAIVSRTARRFLSLLAPHSLAGNAMLPTWGMSETSSSVTFSRRFTLESTSDADLFVEVGEPMPGIDLRLVDAQGEPVPEGKTGRLEIRGVSITPGYHENPAANAESYTPDGWFITGDLGLIKDGQLSITGREKDVIIINGVNFYSHEIEATIERIKGVEISFTAACAVRAAGKDTDELVVFFCPSEAQSSDLSALRRQIKSQVLQDIGAGIDHLVALPRDKIPKTAIGKIQRADLRKQFESGALATPEQPPVGLSWFLARDWCVEPLPANPASAPRTWVIFADAAGLAERVTAVLKARAESVVTVQPGASYQNDEYTEVTIDPAAAGDYSRLLSHLVRSPARPCTFVHLGSFAPGAGEPAAAGARSLMLLAAALARQADRPPARLLVVSSGAQAVLPGDQVVAAQGALLGILKTLPHEIEGLACSHLDVPADPTAATAEAVVNEAQSVPGPIEIALRQGQRYAGRLSPLPLRSGASAPAGLKPGGIYVLTGGLGGIGREIAGNLLTRLQARVVLIGRAPLAALSRDQSQTLESLQQQGPVVYESADVADLAALREIWARVQTRWGAAPDTVLHLAGAYHERLLAEETAEGLDAAFRAKAKGAEAIAEVSRSHPATHVVLFSSLLGYFGGFMTGAYAAANHYLENFAQQQRQLGRNTTCLLWSSWADVGMSKGLRENVALRAKGFLEISPAQGWDSLVLALSSERPVVLIGLDSAHRAVAPYLKAAPTAALGGSARTELLGPRDDVERKIASIWRTLLNLPELDVRDSFFDLGGRSLLAARLFGQINQEFGRNLPLTTLFTYSTVEQLARLIKGQGPVASANRAITLQARGTLAPLFGIPSVGENNLVYRDLVRPLGGERPVFSLSAEQAGAGKPNGQPLAIEPCATDLVEQIRATRPVGPYHLSGHGFGCLIAWEVSRLLGADVRTLVLLEPPPLPFFAPLPEGGAAGFRFITPAKAGLLGRMLRSSEPAVSNAARQARARFGDFTLRPLGQRVIVFGDAPENSPWRLLAPGRFERHDASAAGQKLPGLLSE